MRWGTSGGRIDDGDVDRHGGTVISELRCIDRDVGQLGGVDGLGRVVEVAVEQLLALERGGVGDSVDGLKDRVDLQLVGGLLFRGDASFVGGRGHERPEINLYTSEGFASSSTDSRSLCEQFPTALGR